MPGLRLGVEPEGHPRTGPGLIQGGATEEENGLLSNLLLRLLREDFKAKSASKNAVI